ncbi:MAG: selenocysteine-specific translation elongation factor, partial [Pseudomonadota bacterium]
QLCDPAHVPVLPPAEQRLLARVTAELLRHGRQAPALHDMPEPMQLTLEVLKPFVERMARLGHLHQVGRYRYYLPETLKELANCAEILCEGSEGAGFSAAQYKEHCGIGRNVTIELLEYFDRLGLTRRLGQIRRMRHTVAQVLGS